MISSFSNFNERERIAKQKGKICSLIVLFPEKQLTRFNAQMMGAAKVIIEEDDFPWQVIITFSSSHRGRRHSRRVRSRRGHHR